MADFVMVYLLPDGGEERFELTPNTSYRLGSKPDNDVVIPQKDVSRHHAVVRVHDGWFHVTDLKSKNGTFVNGNQTTAAEFRPGDMLALSSARLLFIEEGSQASTGSGRRDESGVGSTPSNQPQDETGQVRIHVGVDDVVKLMDVTARAMEHRALAEPLAWAVDHLDLDAALVVYRDPDGRVAVVSSAGDLGPLVGQPRILSEIAAGAIREGSGRSRIRHAFEVREDLLVAGARDHHVLILRYAGSPPAVLDVQAVLASVNTILSGDASPGQQHGVDPSGDPENLEGILHGASDEISDVRRRAVAIAAGRRSARLIGVETLSEHVQGRLSEVLDSFERQDEPVILITAVLPDDDGRPPKWQAVEKNRGCEAVEIPPLRRRRCDVPLIAAAVLAREIQHAGLPPTSLSPEVATMLTRYAWPGNVSELREEIIRAAVASGGGAVQVHHFSPSIREASGENLEGDDLTLESFLGLPLAEARDRFEGWLIRRTLTESGGNQSLAARRMGMSRAGLFKKIRKLDIDV
jgi:hypothetical protein